MHINYAFVTLAHLYTTIWGEFFRAKFLKISANNSVTNCMMQAKLKQNNNNSIHNYTQVVNK